MNRSANGMTRMVYVAASNEGGPTLSLADYVRHTRLEKDLSLADVSARSRGQIGKTHINRIENGIVTRVSISKVSALALGLGVPVDELLAVAQGKFPGDDQRNELRLLSYFRQLSPERQEDFVVMLRALVERIPRMDQKS